MDATPPQPEPRPESRPESQPEPAPKPRRWRRRTVRAAAIAATAAAVFASGGCYRVSYETPCFSVSYREARNLEHQLEADQIEELPRPVVLLSGYRAAPSMINRLQNRLVPMTTGDSGDFLAIAYLFEGNIDDAVEQVVAEVNERWPSDNPDETVEVDVVAISMGGVVARAAAEPPEVRGRTTPRLNIARLYTIASPHRGAPIADLVHIDQAGRSLRPGSDWINELNERADYENYELICYAQTRDTWVGALHAAPPGREPYWTPGTLTLSHFTSPTNPWFLTDIALRLRGDAPISTEPTAPPRD